MTTRANRSSAGRMTDDETMRVMLNSALRQQGQGGEVTEILKREPSIYSSTFPLEILTCKSVTGEERKIVCKRQMSDLSVPRHGHRSGLAYEATVYREILKHVHVSSPPFIGAYSDVYSGEFWLFLDYLEESQHVNKLEIQYGVLSAARWLGKFHAENEKRVSENRCPFLIRFDSDYYTGCITRTLELTTSLQQRFPWLPRVCDEFKKSIELLLSEPLTVIHSEFYPRNILVSDGRVYPVDWESAAIAAGEIDLASLTEGWGPSVEQECESAYQRARWPDGAPEVFHTRAKLARAYIEFRWLGDENQRNERGPWRIERLGHLAKELGLFP